MTARSAGDTSSSTAVRIVLRHRCIGVIAPPRRPCPVRVGGQHDATQVRGATQGQARRPIGRSARAGRLPVARRRRCRARGRGDQQSDVGEPQHLRELRRRVHRAQRHRQAPIRDTASHHTTHSTPLAKNRPTRLPLPTPWPSSRRATVGRPLLSLLVGQSVRRGDDICLRAELAHALRARSAGTVGRGSVTRRSSPMCVTMTTPQVSATVGNSNLCWAMTVDSRLKPAAHQGLLADRGLSSTPQATSPCRRRSP